MVTPAALLARLAPMARERATGIIYMANISAHNFFLKTIKIGDAPVAPSNCGIFPLYVLLFGQ
jgi:hypothetical protein